MIATLISLAVFSLSLLAIWLVFGGAEWILHQVCGLIRTSLRSMQSDEVAELWAARFENAAREGMRDRDARREREAAAKRDRDFACGCGRVQQYAPADEPGGITEAEVQSIGWRRVAGVWYCPVCVERD